MIKPTTQQPWIMSLAAAMDLCAFVFMAASNLEITLLAVVGACELALILIAIFAWKKYFEVLIDYRFRELQDSDKNLNQ